MPLASAPQGKKFGAFVGIKTGGYIGFLNYQILVTCGHEGGTPFFGRNRGHEVYGQPLSMWCYEVGVKEPQWHPF